MSRMGRVKDLTGQRFGRLTVIEQHGFTEPNKHGIRYALWFCKCDCGNTCEVSSSNLGKSTKSCGCLAKEHLSEMSKGNITHGMARTHLYRCYHQMLNRCYRTKNDHYHMYGGRGIAVCEEWRSGFEAFRDWAFENGYQEGLSLDRIDVNGDYKPSNCRWINAEDQCHNKRQSRMYEFNGKVQDIAQWAKEYGMEYGTLYSRLKRGMPIEDALSKNWERQRGADGRFRKSCLPHPAN